MDGFGDSFVPPVDGNAGEVDPAAEFLAREQDQLAGLDDDIIPPAASAAAPAQTDGSSPSPAPAAPGLEADLFGAAPMNGGPDLESFEMLGGDEVSQGAPADDPSAEAVAAEEAFAEPAPAEAAPPEGAPEHGGDYSGFGADFGGASVPTGDAAASVGDLSFVGVADASATETSPARPMAYSPIPHVTREEPEKIKIWRQQQEVRLEEKDAAEELAKADLKQKAQKELEDWYKQHEEQVAKTRQANRDASKSAEKELVADIGKMEPGTEWERIAKLCNFNPKTSKSSRDISRMRSIILQVKQNPPLKA
ncbi:clathrin light chain-like isoform X2 [Eriocheir sinensis]|uniref:clathrin light chain-like isoform X2 n=1 Tax=Eriocheir sinensis TaxID=95602 RepID=UPI0021C640DC|nr:clathrin light chain-like isoform X2 [Eriocheir sinensis]